jgi:hypothetical protein
MARRNGEIKRPIKALFYDRKYKLILTLSGVHTASMDERIHGHMVRDEYGAKSAEMSDVRTGRLLAQYSGTAKNAHATYKADPKGFK